MIDSGKRSLAKSFSWRGIALVLLGVISYLITGGNLIETGLITLVYHGLQVGVFFLHERVWNHIDWGRTKGLFIQMTGMSGAGKSTLAKEVQRKLKKKGFRVEVIDGDEYREGLCNDLGFSKEDRNTNIRRLGFVGRVLARNDVISIMSAINPYEEIRQELIEAGGNVRTVYVACDLEILKDRDTKGLYQRTLLPVGHPERVTNLTGVNDPFDVPTDPDLTIHTDDEDFETSVTKLEKFIVGCVS